MRVLVLEDDENREFWFRKKFFGQHIDITAVPQEANELIRNMEYDYIFLDHDLLDEHYVRESKCNETTGLCTAEFLGENLDLCREALVIVHSLNFSGRKRMMDALRDRKALEVPYSELVKKLKVHKA